MKLFTTQNAPNPRIVDMLVIEKHLDIERQTVNMLEGENREPAFLEKNPFGQLPVLETDEGFYLSEVTAIAEYFEEYRADPVIIGVTAQERGEARMWARRIDLMILSPMTMGFQNSIAKKFFEGRIKLYPEIGESMITKANDGLVVLDTLLAGKTYLCGDRFTYGDVMLYAYLDYFRKVGQKVEPGLIHLTEFFDNMSERDSARQTA